jgi:hypothetical protein
VRVGGERYSVCENPPPEDMDIVAQDPVGGDGPSGGVSFVADATKQTLYVAGSKAGPESIAKELGYGDYGKDADPLSMVGGTAEWHGSAEAGHWQLIDLENWHNHWPSGLTDEQVAARRPRDWTWVEQGVRGVPGALRAEPHRRHTAPLTAKRRAARNTDPDIHTALRAARAGVGDPQPAVG